jgi:hypothetical protein
MKMMLNNVRLAFPAIFNPQSFAGSDDSSYSAVMIIDPAKQKDLIKQIEKNIAAVAKEKWGAKAETTLKQITAKGNLCFRDGADKPDYDGFEDMMYISARSKTRPLVLNKDKTPLNEDDGKPYAGCYVNASIDIWAMDNNYGKRICASLRGLQFDDDGEAFGGGGAASADEFEELEATGDVGDLFE